MSEKQVHLQAKVKEKELTLANSKYSGSHIKNSRFVKCKKGFLNN